MAHLGEQFKLTLRRLARWPLFTGIILLTLAIVVAANTVVFSVIDGVIFKPLSYPHPEKLIGIWYKPLVSGFQTSILHPSSTSSRGNKTRPSRTSGRTEAIQ